MEQDGDEFRLSGEESRLCWVAEGVTFQATDVPWLAARALVLAELDAMKFDRAWQANGRKVAGLGPETRQRRFDYHDRRAFGYGLLRAATFRHMQTGSS